MTYCTVSVTGRKFRARGQNCGAPQFSHEMQDSSPSDGQDGARKEAARTLDSLEAGVAARVVAVEGEGAVARRLMEMGVVPGAPVRVVKAAPLGDPLEIRVRDYNLAVRRGEAQTIKVVISDE